MYFKNVLILKQKNRIRIHFIRRRDGGELSLSGRIDHATQRNLRDIAIWKLADKF